MSRPALALTSPDAASPLRALWRADRLADAGGTLANADAPPRPTGFAALDAELPGGGWPGAGLIELLLDAAGSGELRLLAPSLAAACAASPGAAAAVLWVAPPFTPYAPALAALGLKPQQLAIAAPEPGRGHAADAAWATEQALRSGTLAAVLWWQGPEPPVPTTLRRLHLAAEAGHTPLFALRPLAARAPSSPAPLRLALVPAGPSRLAVEVFKRRGPPMAAPLELALPGPLRRRAARRVLPLTQEVLVHVVVRAASERVAA